MVTQRMANKSQDLEDDDQVSPDSAKNETYPQNVQGFALYDTWKRSSYPVHASGNHNSTTQEDGTSVDGKCQLPETLACSRPTASKTSTRIVLA